MTAAFLFNSSLCLFEVVRHFVCSFSFRCRNLLCLLLHLKENPFPSLFLCSEATTWGRSYSTGCTRCLRAPLPCSSSTSFGWNVDGAYPHPKTPLFTQGYHILPLLLLLLLLLLPLLLLLLLLLPPLLLLLLLQMLLPLLPPQPTLSLFTSCILANCSCWRASAFRPTVSPRTSP